MSSPMTSLKMPFSHMAKRPAVDINFRDLSFSAGGHRILKNISGEFKAGELAAVMGPSGAGKSTLMNILAGYVTSGVKGCIDMNGKPRRLKLFNKLSSYIMQDDQLEPYLTVKESMHIASHLKLGDELSDSDKQMAIDEIISTLGLTKCIDTYMDKLSGGQRKRVSIALELVNNPPLIFLDEPTTGLDVVSMNQCMDLMKLLANQGRTVICTIHQPSASNFKRFDNVYIMAKGNCCYHGSPSQVVSFLSSMNLHCPSTYNPADYILEVIDDSTIDSMTGICQNGKQKMSDNQPKTFHSQSSIICVKESIEELPILGSTSLMDFPTTSWVQFQLLFKMMMTQKFRNKAGIWLQIIHHLFSAVLVGSVFFGVGDNASRPIENFKFCLCACVFYMYTHCMTPVVQYPKDVKVMKREYFNRWYNLRSFYIAKTFSTLPIIVILGWVFCTLIYMMTEQPLEWKRFIWFAVITTLIAITSEGLGMAIGFTFSCTNGSIVCPAIMSPILVLSIQGLGYGGYISNILQWIMRLSYLRNGVVALVTSLYLDGRIMKCDDKDLYCFYKDPSVLVRDLAMEHSEPSTEIIGLLMYLVLFRVLAYMALQYRVSTQFSQQISSYVDKIVYIRSKKSELTS